jgi:hypothetical protein
MALKNQENSNFNFYDIFYVNIFMIMTPPTDTLN